MTEKTNIRAFVETRKFWTPLITLASTFLWFGVQAAVPDLNITPDMQFSVMLIMWTIAGLVVGGDIRYDWLQTALEEKSGDPPTLPE